MEGKLVCSDWGLAISCKDPPAEGCVQEPVLWGGLTFAVAQDLAAVKGGMLVEVLHKVTGGPQAEQLLILWSLRLQAPAAVDARLAVTHGFAISNAIQLPGLQGMARSVLHIFSAVGCCKRELTLRPLSGCT